MSLLSLVALLVASPSPTDEGVVYEVEAPAQVEAHDAGGEPADVASEQPDATGEQPPPAAGVEPPPPEQAQPPESQQRGPQQDDPQQHDPQQHDPQQHEPAIAQELAVPDPTAPAEPPVSVQPPSPPPLPPPPPPPNGNGRLVGGSVTLALGLAAGAAVGVEASREDGNPQFVAATFIPLGLAGVGIGTYLLVRGAKARANYLDWRSYAKRDARPSGEGMLVGGVMATVIGGITLVTAGVRAREPGAFDTPLVPALFGVGGVGVLGGVGLVTAGLLRRSRYTVWRQSTFLSHVTPTLTVGRGGFSAGLVGRF